MNYVHFILVSYFILSLLCCFVFGIVNKHKKKRIFMPLTDSIKKDNQINELPRLFVDHTTVQYKYTSCIMTRVKDVDYLLDEWFRYHMAIGVDRFIVADDCSEDNGKTLSILEKYERMGVLTLYRNNPHLDCSNFKPNSSLHMSYMFHREKDKCQWMTSIDPDEYIFPSVETTKIRFLNEVLMSLAAPMSRMLVYWMSNRGDKTRTTEPLIHRYQYGRPQLFIKTFAQSRAVNDWFSAHSPVVNVVWNGTNIQTNVSTAPRYTSDIVNLPHFCFAPAAPVYIRHFRSMSWEDYKLRLKRKYEATGDVNRYKHDTMKPWLAEKNRSTCVLPGSRVFLPAMLDTLYPGKYSGKSESDVTV